MKYRIQTTLKGNWIFKDIRAKIFWYIDIFELLVWLDDELQLKYPDFEKKWRTKLIMVSSVFSVKTMNDESTGHPILSYFA